MDWDFITELIPNFLERIVLGIGACIGYVWALAFDNVHLAMQWFLVLMLSDYLSGVYQALRRGEYDSKKGANGLIKKFIILWLCALAHGLDVIIGITIIQQVFIGAFGLNEMLSILENIGRVHPHFVPEALQSFLTELKNRSSIVRKNRTAEGVEK